MRILLTILALVAAPSVVLAGDTSSTGFPIAGSIGMLIMPTVTGTTITTGPIGSCTTAVTAEGVTVSC